MNVSAGLTIREASRMLDGRETTAEALTRAFLDRIARLDPGIHAYLHVATETALAAARESDARRAAGRRLGPLDGVPIAVKDNICIRGLPATCASKMLAGFVPPYDASVIVRLRRAGAVFLGKTNLDEFAMGSSTEHSAFGPTRNPWDLSRVPGGSSGGSAAAVAAGLAVAALGSDTGGSIRQPAALTGIVGLKPTYGRVSRYGLVAFASSLDQIGPLCKSVEDAALLTEAIEGQDDHDATSVAPPPRRLTADLAKPVKGLKIGVAKEWLGTGLDPEVRAAIETSLAALEKLGCRRVPVSIPSQDAALPVYYLIAPAEASSNLARFDGVRYGARRDGPNVIEMYKATRSAGFGPEVKRRIILGTYVLSAGYYDAYYLKALKARTVLRRQFEAALRSCDVLLSPATPAPAFKLGEKSDDPLQMYLSDVYTVSVNLAGLPALVQPAGYAANGLPIGLQLIGKAFDEGTLLRVGHQYEAATAWHMVRPPLDPAGA